MAEVVGESGIGKSRLLGELGAAAVRDGWTVLTGQASEPDRGSRFGVLGDALGDHIASLDPLEPLRLRLRVGALLEQLAPGRGLVLMLDDLHWGDEASLELLGYLVRHPPRRPLVLAVAYRPSLAPGRLTAVLAQAARQGRAGRVELGPLDVDAVAEFLGPEVSTRRCQVLHEASGGCPFYVAALAQVPEDQLRTTLLAGASGGARSGDAVVSVRDVPAVVRASMQAELADLPDGVRVVAQAAAVAGDLFEPDVLAAIAGMSQQDTDHAVDELVARDLIRPKGRGRFGYWLPMMRAAAYASGGGAWLIQAHARAWEALEERGASVLLRAHHVERCARTGDERAIAVLVDAARMTAARAPANAAHWLSLALDLLPDKGEDDERRLELLADMATFLGMSGRLEQARDVLHEVVRLLPRDAVDQRVRAVGFCATIEHLLGRHTEAGGLLLAELRRLPEHDHDGAAERDGRVTALKLKLATASLLSGDFAQTRTWASAARRAVGGTGDRLVSAGGTGVLALADYVVADIPAAQRNCDRAAELVDGLTDGELARQLDTVVWLGWAEQCLERYNAARRHLERGLSLCRATGQHHLVTYLLVGLDTTLRWQGQLREAADTVAEARESGQLVHSPALRAATLAMRCRIATFTGDSDQAVLLGEEACQLAGPADDWLSVLAAAFLAHARLMAGDPQGCVATLVDAGGGAELPMIPEPARPGWFDVLTTAALALDHVSEADQWAARAEAAAHLGLAGSTAFAQLARARVRHATGDTVGAAGAAHAAATAFRQIGDPLDEGSARLLAGIAMARTGSRAEALRELEQAHALFTQCDATGLHHRAVRELRKLGRRVPLGVSGQRNPRNALGAAALTRRETEIAHWVTQGLTSRQIAGKLYLSPRTVEHHIASIRAKFGVTTRAGIAAALLTAEHTESTERCLTSHPVAASVG
ncbi:DNA-binding CsgD family transcriptional regulator/tetratricopeptide (TPR) repeat protein [Kutzneria kofuensis]|uniref:DNA-binding CsgD family transcriptional regulator/tetratricopeptide (TPR) repeat protein n=1 Tax=Kutzneria kofuensis TaxID=103725 RepID=A0A7W9NLU6_9PSEU|nr:DNA-binding CsgD family transcriptional regulator/tetratricopeptide (TPR) repeat protein [Kutzneria kofuensis]